MNDIEFEEKVVLCAYKPLDEINGEEWRLLEMERNRCRSFPYFLKYGRIIQPPSMDTTGGVIQMQILGHLKKLIASFMEDSLISVAKARQVWISTIVAYYVLHYALFKKGANILLFSKGQPEAQELLAKTKRQYNLLPPFLRLKLDPDSTETLGFPSMISMIKAFASTTSAGISYTASVVVCDEHAEHPYADENYVSSKPTRDAGGQFISVWTKNPWQPDNLAQSIFVDAMEGVNDFKWHFFPWDVVPGRDSEWYERTKRNIPNRELAKLTPALYMQSNYPASLEELLSQPQTVSAFDHKVLTLMMDNTKLPLEIRKDGLDPLTCHIYQDFNSANSYIASSDTSHGVGRDYAVTVIMNSKTGSVVADILSNVLGPEELALHSVKLLKVYDSPLWFIEDNDWGRVTISTAQTLGYTKFGYQDPKRQKIGFHTGDKARFDLFGALIPAINNAEITIYNVNGLKQFFDVIRNAKKNGRIEASGSGHDDYPMAVGICWLKRDEVSPVDWNYEPVRALTFRR